VRHIDTLREAVHRTRRERPFQIDGWVVLPDAMHCVIPCPANDPYFPNPRRTELRRSFRHSALAIAMADRPSGIRPTVAFGWYAGGGSATRRGAAALPQHPSFQQRLHVAPAVEDGVDDDVAFDHLVDHAVGLEGHLTVGRDP